MSRLRAVVVVPARDEEALIGATLDALVDQVDEVGDCFGVLVVDDGSTDRTAAVARGRAVRAARRGVPVRVVDGPGSGVGWARRVGMDAACAWLRRASAASTARAADDASAHGASTDGASADGGSADGASAHGGPADGAPVRGASADGAPSRGGLVVSTDADTRPTSGWLAALLRAADDGHDVIAGDVRIDPARGLGPEATRRRASAATVRLAAVRDVEGAGVAHHHFSAANLAITAHAYDACGGMPTPPALEDEALLDAVRGAGLAVHRTSDAVVHTSPRTTGRAARGLAVDLALESWRATRRYVHDEFDVPRLAAAATDRGVRVAVVVPAKEVAGTIAGVLDRTVGPLRDAGVVDEVLVVDAASADGTAAVAAAHGARVLQQDELVPGAGPCRGKGDAMWRALQATDCDVVAFLDGDTEDPTPAHLAGILGPLLTDDAVAMVRGHFARHRREADGTLSPHDGGRVTELTARPLLNLHHPLLAGFRQPLAGEFAARRSLLARLPFPVGYGVEIATLIDALELVGLDGLAEVDLGTRQNRHQSLRELGPMAFAVLVAVERRLGRGAVLPSSVRLPWAGDLPRAVPVAERPAVGSVGHRTDETRADVAS